MAHSQGFKIAQEKIFPGERKIVNLDVAKLYDFTDISIPIEVYCGAQPGPRLFLSSTIHGDEINGVEIIRRILQKKALRELRGILIAAPIINVFGFNTKSRYLPDRRDLNRSFPGSSRGALASRIAALFMKEVVSKCTHGIDLHTAAIHRNNLPQIRACMDDSEAKKLALRFGAPVVMHSTTRDGSLREATRRKGIPVLLYEGGQALRFDEEAIRLGVQGCLRVMRSIGMLPRKTEKVKKPFVAQSSHWIRAPHSGSVSTEVKLGQEVRKGDEIATLLDPFGRNRIVVMSDVSGIVIGKLELPLVNKGDAMFHIALNEKTQRAKLDFRKNLADRELLNE